MRTLGFRAFPLAISVSALANIALLMLFLPKKIGAYEFQPLLKYFMLLTAAAVTGGVCGWLINNGLSRISDMFYFQVFSLLISGLAALGVFYLISRGLGLKEVNEYLRRLIKK
jgi:hypothetical protein